MPETLSNKGTHPIQAGLPERDLMASLLYLCPGYLKITGKLICVKASPSENFLPCLAKRNKEARSDFSGVHEIICRNFRPEFFPQS
jgi:hypothetical protein